MLLLMGGPRRSGPTVDSMWPDAVCKVRQPVRMKRNKLTAKHSGLLQDGFRREEMSPHQSASYQSTEMQEAGPEEKHGILR